MSPHYRHTQYGWVTLAAVAPGALIALVLVPRAGAPPHLDWVLGLTLALLLAAGVLFSMLTVEIDAQEIRVRFTGGLVRKTIPLADVRRQEPVRNPWYYGWGIHRYSGGWVWNVSGLDAVELQLAGGARFRIGTDEPQALSRAIAQAAPAAGTSGEGLGSDDDARRSNVRSALVVATVVLAGVLAIVGLFKVQMRDPVATVTADTLEIDSLFYGQSYPLTEITGVSLEPRLPHVRMRTNGFAAAGVLRGWFEVEELGRGKLFVDVSEPPFVLVRLRESYVIVGFSHPAKAQALHSELTARAASR